MKDEISRKVNHGFRNASKAGLKEGGHKTEVKGRGENEKLADLCPAGKGEGGGGDKMNSAEKP